MDIFAGVPQGSILGPLLLLVHINILYRDFKGNAKVFTDDTSFLQWPLKTQNDFKVFSQ